MADLAITFHWSPSDMADMTLADLAEWREAAIARLPKPPKDKRR